MTTLAPTPRTTVYTLASTTDGPFLVGFSLFYSDALEVYVDNIPVTGWTVTASFTGGVSTDAAVTLASPATSGAVVRIDGAQVAKREADYVNGDPNLTAKLNIELAEIWASIQELEVATGRSVKIFSTSMPFAPETDAAIVWDGAKFISGPTTDEVANAQGYAETAAAAAAQITSIADDITTVAGIADDVTTVAGIADDVTTVAGQAAQIETVAGQSANITALGPLSTGLAALAQITDELVLISEQSTQALPVLLAGTALSKMPSVYANAGVIVSTSNLMLGAIDINNTAFFPESQAGLGITATIIERGFKANGAPYFKVSLSGTATGSLSFIGYLSEAGRRTVGAGSYTASAKITKLTNVSQAGSGLLVALIEETPANGAVGTTFGNSTNNFAAGQVISTATRTVADGNKIRLALYRSFPSGTVLTNLEFEVEGWRIDAGALRTEGGLKEVTGADAWLLTAPRGARLGYVDGAYTAQHFVNSGIPMDNTPPLWTEGAHLISVNYVPKRIGSRILMEATLPIVGMGNNATAIAVIYVNEVAVNTGSFTPANATYQGNITVRHWLLTSSLDSIKVSLRFGPATGNTAYINTGSGLNTFGGAVSTLLTVEEIAL